MDNSNLISQAEFARKQKCSPQWVSELIKDKRISVTYIAGIPYVDKFTKIKPQSKKIPD